MAEGSNEVLISNILTSMVPKLDDKQLHDLKDVLYIHLHDVDIVKKRYELVPLDSTNDTVKLTRFEMSLKVSNYSPGTIDQYIRAVNKLRAAVGKNFNDITSSDIKFYLAYNQTYNHWKVGTVLNNIHYLNAFYNFLLTEELILKNPMLKVSKPKLEKSIKEAFSPVELEQLRLASRNSTRASALIEFLYATGIRADELHRLNWSDIDLVHLRFKVHGKGNKEREVLLNGKAEFHLRRYLEERMKVEDRTKEEMMSRPLFAGVKKCPSTGDFERLSVGRISDILKEIGKKTGVADIYPHKFRRTFATDAINRGMPIEQLMQLMGHAQYDTTLIYAKVKSRRVEESYRTFCE